MITLSKLLAAYQDLPEFVELELVGVNQKGNFGNTPLHIAVVQGDLSAINVLLDSGADANAKGELGNAPLHDAIMIERVDVIRTLLERGADLSIKNDMGQTPRDIALITSRGKLVNFLDKFDGKSQSG